VAAVTIGKPRSRLQRMKNLPFSRRLRFAFTGIASALATERSFRIQAAAGIVVIALLVWLKPAPLWWALVALTIGGVIASELVNTAIEHLADHLHPELHPKIKLVKDCAAAAVLVMSLAALGVAAALAVELVAGR
jgi:undecaprenol kinase